MNAFHTMKNTVKNLAITATLVTGLALAPAAIAGDDRGKHVNKDRNISSQKHHNKRKHNSSYVSGHGNKHGSYAKGHKRHDNHGHRSHKKMKHNKHYAHNYRRHHHGHRDIHTVVNHYDLHDHGHSHSYYDPRIRIGLHLGHFDLLFQE